MKARVARWLTLALALIPAGGWIACSGYGAPGNPSAQLNFGVSMAEKGLWSEALFRFEKAAQMAPENVNVLNNLAVAEEALGHFDAALKHYQEALKLEPGNLALKRNYSRFIEFYQSFKPQAGGASKEPGVAKGASRPTAGNSRPGRAPRAGGQGGNDHE